MKWGQLLESACRSSWGETAVTVHDPSGFIGGGFPMDALTLEELMPEVANVFARQEDAFSNCMLIISTTIAKQEEENRLKASVEEILQLRGDVKKSTDLINESKKMIQRLEKTQARLLEELDELRRENTEKDAMLERLLEQQEQHLDEYDSHLKELDDRFDYVSKMRMEQKELQSRVEKQEKNYAELQFGVAMLSKSIGDESDGAGSGASPIVAPVPLAPPIQRSRSGRKIPMAKSGSATLLNGRKLSKAVTRLPPNDVLFPTTAHHPPVEHYTTSYIQPSSGTATPTKVFPVTRKPSGDALAQVDSELLVRQASSIFRPLSPPPKTPLLDEPTPLSPKLSSIDLLSFDLQPSSSRDVELERRPSADVNVATNFYALSSSQVQEISTSDPGATASLESSREDMKVYNNDSIEMTEALPTQPAAPTTSRQSSVQHMEISAPAPLNHEDSLSREFVSQESQESSGQSTSEYHQQDALEPNRSELIPQASPDMETPKLATATPPITQRLEESPRVFDDHSPSPRLDETLGTTLLVDELLQLEETPQQMQKPPPQHHEVIPHEGTTTSQTHNIQSEIESTSQSQQQELPPTRSVESKPDLSETHSTTTTTNKTLAQESHQKQQLKRQHTSTEKDPHKKSSTEQKKASTPKAAKATTKTAATPTTSVSKQDTKREPVTRKKSAKAINASEDTVVAPISSSREESTQLETATSSNKATGIRSSEEYHYLWHWAYSNIVVLSRMHGKHNVQQLFTDEKKDTVASRVRQMEETVGGMRAIVDSLNDHLGTIHNVKQNIETIQTTTMELHNGMAKMQRASEETSNTTQSLTNQLQKLDSFVQELVQGYSAAMNKTPPKPATPRPVEPTVTLAEFQNFQSHVAQLETTLAQLDPFMAEFRSARDQAKRELQAVLASQTSQASSLEKDLIKTNDDMRKRSQEHKKELEELTVYANDVVDRLYVWIQFFAETLHVAFANESPASGTIHRLLIAVFRGKYTSLSAKLLLLADQHAGLPIEAPARAVSGHADGLVDVKDRDVDAYLSSGFPLLATLVSALDKWEERSLATPMIRLVRETLVEAKAITCVNPFQQRFSAVNAKINTLNTEVSGNFTSVIMEAKIRVAETKAAVGVHSTEIRELNHLHTAVKTVTTKVDYVVNNTQMMIVEDDLKKIVTKLNTERNQLKTDLEAAIKQVANSSVEKEKELEREARRMRIHESLDREELGFVQESMQDAMSRLEREVVSHDEFVVLADRLKRKPDANDIRTYIQQKIAGLKLQQGEASHEAPLLGSVPVRCISCQNAVAAKLEPHAQQQPSKKEAKDVLPFTTSSVRHVQKQKLEAMLKAKAAMDK
ncbi:hypothetical protein AC1031_003738 [Aphanomyces cochlioides]|nr:hypothetical protein AC1031_003738 [Aphanomyces cochlioides]